MGWNPSKRDSRKFVGMTRKMTGCCRNVAAAVAEVDVAGMKSVAVDTSVAVAGAVDTSVAVMAVGAVDMSVAGAADSSVVVAGAAVDREPVVAVDTAVADAGSVACAVAATAWNSIVADTVVVVTAVVVTAVVVAVAAPCWLEKNRETSDVRKGRSWAFAALLLLQEEPRLLPRAWRRPERSPWHHRPMNHHHPLQGAEIPCYQTSCMLLVATSDCSAATTASIIAFLLVGSSWCSNYF
jgi:hypothetical protein